MSENTQIEIGKEKVFLGGTCDQNDWRVSIFLPGMADRGYPNALFFNPVVPDWNEEVQKLEDAAKVKLPYQVYCIANPNPSWANEKFSAYSLLEATMALYDDPDRTIVIFDTTGMDGHPLKAMNKSLKDLTKRFPDAMIYGTLDEAMDAVAKLLEG